MFAFSLIEVVGIRLSVIASVVIGGAWYSPVFAGPLWMREVGLTEEKMRNARLTPVGILTLAVVLDALFAVLMNVLFTWMKVHNVAQGALLAMACTLVFYVVPQLVHSVFDDSSKKVWLLYSAHELFHAAAVGAIVSWSIIA